MALYAANFGGNTGAGAAGGAASTVGAIQAMTDTSSAPTAMWGVKTIVRAAGPTTLGPLRRRLRVTPTSPSTTASWTTDRTLTALTSRRCCEVLAAPGRSDFDVLTFDFGLAVRPAPSAA